MDNTTRGPREKMPNAMQVKFTPLRAILCGAAWLALGGCRQAGPETSSKASPPLSVQTVLPRRGEIARVITLPSFRIRAIQDATLYAKVSGYLKTLSVDKGDSVTNGQLLGEIEVPELLA